MNEAPGFTNDYIDKNYLNIVDINSIISKNEPPQLDFILPGLPKQSVGLLIGKGGVGKSMFAMQLLKDLATKQNQLGLNPEKKRRRVTYLSLEDSEQIIKMRFHNVISASSINEINDFNQYARFITPIIPIELNIGASPAMDRLYDVASESHLLIIDTLSRLHSVEENSNSEMAIILGKLEQIAREADCAILIVHHVAKSSEYLQNAKQYSVPHTARGASAITDNARFVMRLSTSAKNEIMLNFDKVNYTKKLDPISYCLNEKGMLELRSEHVNLTSKKNTKHIDDNDGWE